MATVVLVLALPALSGSTDLLACVIHASVLTGGISDTAPTMVVFPTPNPPATTSLAEVSRGMPSGELSKAIDDSLQKVCIKRGRIGVGIDQHAVLRGEITQQHPRDSE